MSELYQEYPEPGEDELVDALWQEIADHHAAARVAGETRYRGFNSKTYGGFRGYLDIPDNEDRRNKRTFGPGFRFR